MQTGREAAAVFSILGCTTHLAREREIIFEKEKTYCQPSIHFFVVNNLSNVKVYDDSSNLGCQAGAISGTSWAPAFLPAVVQPARSLVPSALSPRG